MQLALAMSREEADAEETKKKSDDMRLTLAIQKSKADNSEKVGSRRSRCIKKTFLPQPAAASGGSALNDLVDLNFGGVAPAQVLSYLPTVVYINQCESVLKVSFYTFYQGPSPPQRTAASLDPWSPAGQTGDNGAGGDPWGGNIVSQSTIPDPWGGIGAHGVPPSRASPLAFHQGSPPQADPWGSGGESTGGGLYPNLGGAGVGGPDPWSAQPQQASASPVPAVDPFSPGSPVKAGGAGADLLAADWTSNGAATGNGGILGATGGNGSPSHMAPQVFSDVKKNSLCQKFQP